MADLADKTYAVDRIEGGMALCECLETGSRLTVDIAHLPPGVKEGDIVRQDGDGFVLDQAQTEDRRKRLKDRLDRLFEERK